jgi:hypothetical protein
VTTGHEPVLRGLLAISQRSVAYAA